MIDGDGALSRDRQRIERFAAGLSDKYAWTFDASDALRPDAVMPVYIVTPRFARAWNGALPLGETATQWTFGESSVTAAAP